MTFLTEEERVKLKRSHRAERDRKIADRIKAVLLSDSGWSNRKIAEALLLDEDTIGQHITEYKSRGKLKNESGGSSGKLSGSQTAELLQHLTEKTYSKVCDICKYVEAKYGVKYTVAGMTSWLKSHKFSFIKPHSVPAKADPLKQAEFVETYENLKATTPAEEPIIFLDAVHPTMATKVTYGWIRKGTRKLIKSTASKARMNIIGALNLKTMQVEIADYKTVNSESLVDFFDVLKKKYPSNNKIHVILDNGPANTSKNTRNEAERRNIILHYLPPYSPNLNPIERLWKLMHEHARNNKFFSSVRDFRDSIFRFFNVTWCNISPAASSRLNDHFHLLQSPAFSF